MFSSGIFAFLMFSRFILIWLSQSAFAHNINRCEHVGTCVFPPNIYGASFSLRSLSLTILIFQGWILRADGLFLIMSFNSWIVPSSIFYHCSSCLNIALQQVLWIPYCIPSYGNIIISWLSCLYYYLVRFQKRKKEPQSCQIFIKTNYLKIVNVSFSF